MSLLMPETADHDLLELLTGAPFRAPYLAEVLDWITRAARDDHERGRSRSESLPGEVVRRLEAYSRTFELGARELAERMADARSALAAVVHHHYVGLLLKDSPDDHRHGQVVSGASLRRLATAVGRGRAISGGRATVVIVHGPASTSVYRPVSRDHAHHLKLSARKDKEGAARLAETVTAILARHVRMADWSDPVGGGVEVEARSHLVAVSWRSTHDDARSWIDDGTRDLCIAALNHRGHTVTVSADGTLRIHPPL
ncbi:hypothetical protein OG689_44610 [Kitasatospora sp. NBC_00240]|uniref:hypothetical protein n=1 Tax=Kitasatospora sp. NBC_00240 TaxID=2903567 RepID=UPI0022533033|nr:hypothetical protein [Kitasatospora sp. NBC_00240]MCX5216222.1 hypothetical protein [Kitasatospora sp. NBC_00240]